MRRGRWSWSAALVLLALGWARARAPAVVGRTRASPPASAAASPSASPPPPPPTSPSPHGSAGARAGLDAFESAASCAALVGAGQRLARAPGIARFASWNLHWFPDGEPGTRQAGADLSWLGCALAWLDADVIAVQEVKQSPSAEQALTTVLAELNRWTKARYVA